MPEGSRLWRWLWGPSKKPPIPPPDQLENLNEINADLDDARRAHRRRGNPQYRTDIDPHEIHWGPRYNTQEARDYDPKFGRYTWRQWLLLHAPWPFSLTFRKPSDIHPILFSNILYVLICVIALIFIAVALIATLSPVFHAYIARLLAIPEGIFP